MGGDGGDWAGCWCVGGDKVIMREEGVMRWVGGDGG